MPTSIEFLSSMTRDPDPSPSTSRRATVQHALLLVALVTAAGLVSVWRGQDANWDLQNYHYYNPWAWWNGRIFDRDIAAAQLQTFHNPLFDLPFFAMVQWNWPPRVIAFLLAVPAGVAAYFLARLVTLLFDDLPAQERRVAAGGAFAIGVTSAMGIATLGTTMNEWPGAALVIAALWLVVRDLMQGEAGAIAVRTLVIAGFLAGIASGGKLTAAVFPLALCAALALRTPRGPAGWMGSVREAAIFAASVAAGLAVALGPWAYALATHYGNPVFPYFNEWIRSPWWDAAPIARVYGPHSLERWLVFPFHLVGPGERFVSEVPYRDARFPVAWGLAIVAGATWLAFRLAGRTLPKSPRGISASWRLTGIFIGVSFLVWTAQHSVYRYIVLLDLLTGAAIVTLLARLVRPGYLPAIAVIAAVALIATTRVADWWHVGFGDQWFEVHAPPLPPNALVLLTTDAPVAYLLPMLGSDARFVGARNTIVDPDRKNKLAQSVSDAVRMHAGPLYQLTSPPGAGADALAAHGLRRADGACLPVESNIDTRRVELCRLSRVQQGPSP
jgi:hypothetical protein